MKKPSMRPEYEALSELNWICQNSGVDIHMTSVGDDTIVVMRRNHEMTSFLIHDEEPIEPKMRREKTKMAIMHAGEQLV